MKTITREVVTKVTENIITLEDIITWMAREGCLGRFMIGFINQHTTVESITEYLEYIEAVPEDVISGAFEWRSEVLYWNKLSIEWRSYLKKHNVKKFELR